MSVTALSSATSAPITFAKGNSPAADCRASRAILPAGRKAPTSASGAPPIAASEVAHVNLADGVPLTFSVSPGAVLYFAPTITATFLWCEIFFSSIFRN